MESQDPEQRSLNRDGSVATDDTARLTGSFLKLIAIEDLSIPEITWLEAGFLSRSLPWLEYLLNNRKSFTGAEKAADELMELIEIRSAWLQAMAAENPVDPENARERRQAIRSLNFLADWNSVYPEIKRGGRGQKQPAVRMRALLAAERHHLEFLEKVAAFDRVPEGVSPEEVRLQLETLQQLSKTMESH